MTGGAVGCPVIVVHGGAGEIPDDLCAGLREGCEAAAQTGFAVLCGGGSALDAVEAAVRALEDDARFNAGRGACLTRAGTIEVDAAVMVGATLAAGAVAAAPNLLHPVTLARRVLERGEHVLLAGDGALAFAREVGIEPTPAAELLTPHAEQRFADLWSDQQKHGLGDTVGAVAQDRAGGMAAATSTGGTAFKRSGRIGDSPIPGAGLYADDEWGGASATGHGESILRACLCRDALERVSGGADPMAAAQDAVARMLARTGGRGGVILLSPDGRVGTAHSTSRMSFAWRSGDGTSGSGTESPRG